MCTLHLAAKSDRKRNRLVLTKFKKNLRASALAFYAEYIRNNQSIKLFILEKKKKVLSNTFTERETQEKEETTQRQSVKTCDMKIVVHTHKKKQEQHAW